MRSTQDRGGVDGEIRLQGYMQAEFGHIRYYLANQLRRYAADPFVSSLAAGTRLHCLLYHFQGTELIRAEEIAV